MNKRNAQPGDGVKKKKLKHFESLDPVELDIPDGEIWTYAVDGLHAPAIHTAVKNKRIKQAAFIVLVLAAVILSCYFSIRAVKRDTLEYTVSDSGYVFKGFSNTGYIKELDISCVTDIEYIDGETDFEKNFYFTEDKSKPVTALNNFAFNCDNVLKTVNIGASVLKIEKDSFYSCWALTCINVDENNPNYCSVDGVLYNKDMTEIICCPIRHSEYLADKYGYSEPPEKEDAGYDGYVKNVLTFTVPESVTVIGELSFNYTDIHVLYLPEGLKTIETMSFFKSTSLESIFTYAQDGEQKKVYASFPESIEYIGSDAFSYDQALKYVYIPENITFIGHHAFWECVYKSDGEILGLTDIGTALSEKELASQCHFGDQWLPEYDYRLFKKAVQVNYASQREAFE